MKFRSSHMIPLSPVLTGWCRLDGQIQSVYLDFKNQGNLSKMQGNDGRGGGVGIDGGERPSVSILAGS